MLFCCSFHLVVFVFPHLSFPLLNFPYSLYIFSLLLLFVTHHLLSLVCSVFHIFNLTVMNFDFVICGVGYILLRFNKCYIKFYIAEMQDTDGAYSAPLVKLLYFFFLLYSVISVSIHEKAASDLPYI